LLGAAFPKKAFTANAVDFGEDRSRTGFDSQKASRAE